MIAVRLATPDDLPAIEEVMRASMAAIGARYYDAQQTASAVMYIAVADRQLIDDGTFFVVTDDDRVVACGGWSSRKKLFTGTNEQAAAEGMLDPATDAARVRAMFVHPDYARRGLGRMILEASEAAAQRAGFTRFELMATLPGVPLYEACGYEAVERVTNELPDGATLETVRMTRKGNAAVRGG
jgi:GNAT superfamily N-acetyltransferase